MEFANIINEEIRKILNEGYVMSDDRFQFTQKLNNSTFYKYETFTTEFDVDIKESNIAVTWKVSFWLNQMGIENLIIDVEKVEGEFMLELYDKHTNELKQETTKNIQDFEWKFYIEDANLVKGGSLYIESLDFDFSKKICVVNF